MGVYGVTWALGLVMGPALGMRLYGWNPSIYWTAGLALGVVAALSVGRPSREPIEAYKPVLPSP